MRLRVFRDSTCDRPPTACGRPCSTSWRRASKVPIFADLYAGTGAVGIEALSRGAARAIFVEQKYAAVKAIRENLRSLGIEGRAEVRQGRATAMIPRLEAGIVFLDPPYALENEYTAALDLLGEKPPPLVIAQHPPRLKLADRYGDLHRTRLVKHGDNALSFYEPGGFKD